MTNGSKPLSSDDKSGAEFAREMLQGDPTFGINFDRIQWDSSQNCYVIVEFLFCDPSQFEKGITPYNSHPNRYFHKNSQKFISLWELANKLGAKLILVNYTSRGTKYEDEVLVMNVNSINKDKTPPVETSDKRMTRAEFSKWFRELNARGKR